MLTLVIILTLSLLIAFYIKKTKTDMGDPVEQFVITMMVALAILISCAFNGIVCGLTKKESYVDKFSQGIESFDRVGVQFVLGTKTIHGVERYLYYTNEGGKYALDYVSVFNSYLITKGGIPRIEWKVTHYKPNGWLALFNWCSSETSKYELYLPVDTKVERNTF